MDNQVPPPFPQTPSEAPGAKTARTCGILSIIFAVTCIGIPVALVLGIVALVQQAKAKHLAHEFPQDYRMPTTSGLVLGIIGLVMPILMLPFIGIVSAIAIPALLQQRGRAVGKVISANLTSQMEQLIGEYYKGKEVGLDQPAIHASLEHALQASQERNPLNKEAPAFRYSISIVSAQSTEEAQQQAEAEATTEGEIVFVVSYPTESQQPGYIAGAAKLKTPLNGSNIISRGMTLD